MAKLVNNTNEPVEFEYPDDEGVESAMLVGPGGDISPQIDSAVWKAGVEAGLTVVDDG